MAATHYGGNWKGTSIPTKFGIDSQAALALYESKKSMRLPKRIEIRYNFINVCIERKIISTFYLSSEENIADALTKPLGRTKFEKLREKFGIILITGNNAK